MVIEQIKAIDQPLLIVAPKTTQTKILKAFYQDKIFKPVTLMQKQDLFDKVFFKYTEDALITASMFLKLKPSIVKPLLKQLYKIEINQDYSDDNIETLKQLKKHLLEQGKIMPFNHHALFFKQYHVLLLDYPHDMELNALMSHISKVTTVDTIDSKLSGKKQFTYASFCTVEEEIIQTLLEINALTNQGVNLDEIAIVDVPASYQTLFLTTARRMGIPINYNQAKTLFQFPLTKRFLNELKASEKETLFERFLDAFDKIEQFRRHNIVNDKVYKKLLSRLNTFVKSTVYFDTLYPFIIDQLKAVKVKTETLKGAVNHITMDEVDPMKHQYLFFIGLHEGHFPKPKTEDDFLDEAAKKLLNYPTAEQLNQQEKARILTIIETLNHGYFSYAEQSVTESFFEANLLKEIRVKHDLRPFDKYDEAAQTISFQEALLYTKKLYDNYLIYHENHPDLEGLFPTFKDHFRPYDTQFKPLSNTMQKHLIKSQLN